MQLRMKKDSVLTVKALAEVATLIKEEDLCNVTWPIRSEDDQGDEDDTHMVGGPCDIPEDSHVSSDSVEDTVIEEQECNTHDTVVPTDNGLADTSTDTGLAPNGWERVDSDIQFLNVEWT